ncbi:MAG: F0F1 ATP synthase subunit B [Acidimicrobiales bacterium]
MSAEELITLDLDLDLELAVEAGTEAESEETVNPVIPEIHEIIWPAIFFIVLWILMRHVLLGPLLRVREARAAKLAEDADAADTARAELVRVEQEYREALAKARQSADEMVATAREEAEAYRREQVHAVEAEITRQRLALDEEIHSARDTALASLRPQVTTLAVGAAARVLDRPLDEATYAAIVEQTLADRS